MTGPVLTGTVCRGEGDTGEKMEGTNRRTENGHTENCDKNGHRSSVTRAPCFLRLLIRDMTCRNFLFLVDFGSSRLEL